MNEDYIQHYGVLGMKWGIRRYQKKNGGLTPAGKSRYKYESMSTKRYNRKAAKQRENEARHEAAAKNSTGGKRERELAKAKVSSEKAKKFEQRAKRSAEHDSNMQNFAEKTSAGSAFAVEALVGSFNYNSYVRQKAAGISTGRAMVNTYFTGPLAGYVAKARYIRQDERRRG